MYSSCVYLVLRFWGHGVIVVRIGWAVFVLTDFLFFHVLVWDLCQPWFFLSVWDLTFGFVDISCSPSYYLHSLFHLVCRSFSALIYLVLFRVPLDLVRHLCQYWWGRPICLRMEFRFVWTVRPSVSLPPATDCFQFLEYSRRVMESVPFRLGWGSLVVGSVCYFPCDSLGLAVSTKGDCVFSIVDVKASVVSLHSDKITLLWPRLTIFAHEFWSWSVWLPGCLILGHSFIWWPCSLQRKQVIGCSS